MLVNIAGGRIVVLEQTTKITQKILFILFFFFDSKDLKIPHILEQTTQNAVVVPRSNCMGIMARSICV